MYDIYYHGVSIIPEKTLVRVPMSTCQDQPQYNFNEDIAQSVAKLKL